MGEEGVAEVALAASLSAEEDSDKEADDPDLPRLLERTFASRAATLRPVAKGKERKGKERKGGKVQVKQSKARLVRVMRGFRFQPAGLGGGVHALQNGGHGRLATSWILGWNRLDRRVWHVIAWYEGGK
jgi:hypothetical protein